MKSQYQKSCLTGIGLIILVLAISFSQPLPGENSVIIHRATGKIYPDGNLDECDWIKAAPVGKFLVYPTHDPEQNEVTEAKMLWDDESLYIAFKTIDKNILSTRTQRYEDVFNDDCVEAFISPFADSPQIYTNIEINALGTFLSEIHLEKPNPELQKLAREVQSLQDRRKNGSASKKPLLPSRASGQSFP